MNSNQTLSRVAGSLYLVVILGIIFGEFYVRGNLIAWGDTATTAQNILASEGLFRLGFVIDLVAELCFLLMVLAVYQLLKSVNKTYALVMVSCVLACVVIKVINMLNLYAALLIFKGSAGYAGMNYLSVFTVDQLHAQAFFFLDLHSVCFEMAGIFFSFWLLPLGYLVLKSGSGSFSRFLGWWLMITCFALLFNFFTRFLVPEFFRSEIFWITGAMDSSEIVFCFWLLFKGINVKQVE